MENEFLQSLKDPATLNNLIAEWNASRLDMFALKTPNENLEFSGVMRFYFQDRGQKAVTKCIRVHSNQTVGEIMPTLIEKFCPDMKMLSTPNYELYEIHETGDVRTLDAPEKPLLVQLLWHNDDREGRFVLKSADLKIQPIKFFDLNPDEGQLKRRLSRRDKKNLKKQRKAEIAKRNKDKNKLLAHHVYSEVPESSFTRTKSNPEAVMRRRRQQKLEKRMKEFQNQSGPQTGGILKVFAESLKPEIPYKTILASVKDNANVVTKAALEKFLLGKEDPGNYCIVMAIIPPGDPSMPGNVAKERIIRSSDCPLAIQNSWPRSKGVITFHLRRREPGTEQPTHKSDQRSKSTSSVPIKKQPPPQDLQKNFSSSDLPVDRSFDRDSLPYFIELTPEGKEINYKPKIYYIRPDETIIGSSKNPSPGVQYLQLFSPKILASHCSIVNADGVVSIVPHGPDADVRISGKRVYDNSLLTTGNVVQFGGLHTFRFHNPLDAPPDRNSVISDDNRSSVASFEYPSYNKSQKESRQPDVSSPPISPELKNLILNEPGSNVDDELVETTFGVDGGIETNMKTKQQISAAISAENLLDFDRDQLRNSLRHKKVNASLPDLLNSKEEYEENLLPAALSFLDHGKDAFFAAIISGVNGAAVNFKLAPTYTLYLAARHALTPCYRPGLTEQDRARMLSSITKRIASSIQQTIQENDSLAGGLAFWMANASELLHFYRQDSDVSPLTMSAQATLAQSIQESFALLVNAMEEELSLALPAFLEPSDNVDIHPQDLDDILNDDLLERAESMELLNWTSDSDDRVIRVDENGRPISGEQWITPAARIRHHGMPIMADVLYILSSAMSLLRRCRVNAALTIQLFSQLFHFINMWIFNRIVLEPNMRLCTRLWGHRLRMRLSFIEAWAERQGLELAADCHLARIIQTAHLLEAPKDSADDIADIAAACFKLNSLQLRFLLENYLPDRDEPLIPQELIDSIVSVAESTSDELTLVDGREVKLEEDVQLQLPFLLPEEGYSSDIIRGVPPGLQEFLEPLCDTGLCSLTLNPHSLGLWTVYQDPLEDDLDDHSRDSMIDDEPLIQRVIIDKGNSGLGLSICSAKGTQSDFSGIYVKAVLPEGVADKDGRIDAGDQILAVNESSLIDVTQVQAAKIMGKSGPVITLEVMKNAAFHHGLHKLVEQLPDKGGNHAKQKSTDSRDSRDSRSYDYKQPPPKQQQQYVENGDVEQYEKEQLSGYASRDLDNQRDSYSDPLDSKQSRYGYNDRQPVSSNPAFGYGETDIDAPYETNIDDDVDYPTKQPIVDGYGDPVEPEEQQEETNQHQDEYRESDYDSDGNLLTAEEKARLKRQRQRQIEYEERLAKWEAERVKQEELVKQQEEDKKREESEKWAEEEERRLEEEAELRYEEKLSEDVNVKVQVDVTQEKGTPQDVDVKNQEEARGEANRRQSEIEARREAERIRQETEKRRQEYERKRQDEERREKEREQARRDEENRRKKQEEERIEQERIEEERKREKERKREQERREAEERRAREAAERRQREEREAAERRREEERERKRIEEQQQRKKREEEERKKREEREKEERLHREQERQAKDREQRRIEEERKQREYEEKERLEQERRRQEFLAEQQRRRDEEKREEEERRRQEKQRLIEEKRRRDEELRAEDDRRRKEAEEKRRHEYEQRRERERREEEERRQKREADERRRKEEEDRRAADARKPTAQRTSSSQLQKEMDNIDDALREAERIAAEMDLFMMEEEQKIEESVKEKREKEKIEWQEQANSLPRQESKRFSNYNDDGIDDTDFLPPPPENLLSDDFGYSRQQSANSRYDINNPSLSSTDDVSSSAAVDNRSSPPQPTVDTNHSTDDALTEQQKWMQEQREKREKRKQEQERLKQENLRKREEELEQARKAVELKREQENKQMNEYKRHRDEQERKEREAEAERRRQPPPSVKPKHYKLNQQLSGGLPDVIRGEYKQTAERDYDRRRQEIDRLPEVKHSLSSHPDSSDEEDGDAPPRPPPPKNVPASPLSPVNSRSKFNYSSSNGYQRGTSNQSSPGGSVSISVNSKTGLVQNNNNVFVKRTPPPVVVNQGVGEPEVLDFRAKMKLFGK